MVGVGTKRQRTAGVHVAAEKQDAFYPFRAFIGQNHGGAGAVAPADKCGCANSQVIHDCADVGGKQLVAIGPAIACAAAMAAAVDEDGAIAGSQERGQLVAPIAGMAEAAVQQDDRWSLPETGVPD